MGACLCKENAQEHFIADQFDLLVEECLEEILEMHHNKSDHPNQTVQSEDHTDDHTEEHTEDEPRVVEPFIWIQLIKSIVRGVPIEHPMGLSIIQFLLRSCSVPAGNPVLLVSDILSHSLKHTPREIRNLCVILCILTETLDGPSSNALLSKTTLGYLIGNLDEGTHPDVMLFSMMALDKLSQQIERTTTRKLSVFSQDTLVRLERHSNSEDFVLRQVAFCAKLCLKNYFGIKGRKSFQNVNVTLKMDNSLQYLKISADGLEARCDAFSFDSVRCTYQVNSGCWYYECLIITSGVMQMGWSTKDNPNYLSREGRGIGDDQYSISFDGCRRVVWYNNKPQSFDLPQWTSGSIVGCLLDLDARQVIFSLNGIERSVWTPLFESAGDGFYAAASFMSFQQCRFNFGSKPFRYPPKNRDFYSFNRHAILKQ